MVVLLGKNDFIKFFSLIVLLLGFFVSITGNYTNSIMIKDESLTYNTNLVAHAPILIDSNGDFTTLGFSGDGTAGNPYIIEKLNITATGAFVSGIEVRSTTVHFVIKDCIVQTEYVGILLQDIGDHTSTLINNICISTSGDGGGIGISFTTGCIVTENECFNFMQGIHLNEASEVYISGNIITSNNYQ